MTKRTALWTAVVGCLVSGALMAADAAPSALNVLRDLSSRVQGRAMVVGVTGTYPIIDYTYYDYDPETFVVDIADVDVSQLPKTLQVNAGGVGLVKVEPISQGRGRLEDLDTLEAWFPQLELLSNCGLGQTALVPARDMLKHFRAEVEAHIRQGICPSAICPMKTPEITEETR